MSIYGSIYRGALLPAYEMLRGRNMSSHLREFRETQWLRLEQHRSRQWEAIQRMLRHAYEQTAFYKERFAQADLKPDDMTSWGDFGQLPFLEKEDLQLHQDELISKSYRDQPLITSHSGGSTGQPVEFKFDRYHYDRRCAAWARADSWAGALPGEKQIRLWLGVGSGVGKRPWKEVIKERLHWAIMRWKTITATNLSPESVRKYCDIMHRFPPRTMYALAQSAYSFALLLEKQALQPPRMQGIILGAEKIFPEQRKKIEEVFQTPTFERYGCQEFCNIGEECEYHNGMHINADGLYVEVVDDEGQPLPPGEPGEIVVTSLDNFAMPFIRYKLGDMGVLAEGECPCGRGLPRIKEVLGRTCDMIVTPEGTVCSGIMMPHFMKEFSCIREFQFVQEAVDHLTVRVVPGEDWNKPAQNYMEEELRRWVGHTMDIDFEEVSELEKAGSGKYRMVISRVPVVAQGSL